MFVNLKSLSILGRGLILCEEFEYYALCPTWKKTLDTIFGNCGKLSAIEINFFPVEWKTKFSDFNE